MSILDLFSKRQKSLRGEMPDVYVYDKIPQPLRVQIIHIWRDTLGNEEQYVDSYVSTYKSYKYIVERLCREYGVFFLTDTGYGDRHYLQELANFLLREQDPEKVLDAVEFSFGVIDTFTRELDYLKRHDASERADNAIEELNARFREHGIGYQYIRTKIIRVDSEFIHAEAVKPALGLLRAPEYAGAQAEFLSAHEHYRNGRSKEALTDCLKSLESVMKTVCAKRAWKHAPNATSNALIQVLFDNDLIPSFWNAHFSALRSILETGVPTARNKLGGHGQGTEVVEVPQHIVAYVLHQTASAIVFLAEAEKAL
ncbi:MAG: hypothetical protein JXA73_15490 [Acidobacteria bacterium]|nr:hypothetical protein [Acidobacteriota bacterium]